MTARLALGSVIVTIVAGCADQMGVNPNQRIRQVCPPQSSADLFFSNSDDRRVPVIFTGLLAEMQEPSLTCGNVPIEVYRLLYVTDVRIRVIRISRRDDRFDLLYAERPFRVFPGAASQWPNPLRREKALMREQWKEITATLDERGFWTMPGSAIDGVDTLALLEGRRGERYRALNRFGLGPDVNEFEKMLPIFLSLADTK